MVCWSSRFKRASTKEAAIYYYLTQSVKRRLILELKDSFSRHPLYEKIVPFIQNKFAFDERPQFGIIVKNASANKVSLSADNFVGTVNSYVMLAYIRHPVYPLEWVREDLNCVRLNDDKMPTPAGVYYIEILKAPENAQDEGLYVIDPLLTQTDEPVLQFLSGIEREAQLQHAPVKGTLRLWQNRHYLLVEGVDYSVDYSTGAITFLTTFNANAYVTGDYRYPAPSIGPVPFFWNTADFKTLHGIVLAFGKRAKVGDKVAVVVYPDRVESANAYGGRFDLTFELDVISQDTNQMEEMADLVTMFLWGEKRPILSIEGIEITNISMGGESEEPYDEAADLNYYIASLSIEIQADWEIHLPLPLTISRFGPRPTEGQPGGLAGIVAGISPVQSGPYNNLFFQTVPIIAGRNNSFERIT
jgi:hypothetical protein